MDPLTFSLIVLAALAALAGWELVVRPLLVDED